LNSSNLAKTIRNVTLILNPGGNCDITLGYILDDGSVEIITKNYKALNDDFPKTIQEKEKIKKFMFVKFFMTNKTTNRMTFERLILEYINSGKYRGE
jgi:acyl CoA:acetate/3-ketoacid CoA transferase alpha subunit